MSLRSMAKKIIDYTIEDEYKVYRLKATPFVYRKRFTASFHKKYDNESVVKGKVVFDNYMGSGYGCNGKYVLEFLLANEPELAGELDLVWVVKDVHNRRGEFPEQVRLVEYGSEQAMYEYATAQVWVKNFQMVHYLNKGLLKRDGQYYIQMWHGSFGIKKIEGNCGYLNRDRAWVSLAKKNADYTDYWISNSAFETQVYKDAFWGAGKILEYGHPRNDILVDGMQATYDKVRKTYSLEGKRMVLFVPTFRDQDKSSVSVPDKEAVLESLHKRFGGDWVFALRNHPRIAAQSLQMSEENVIDVTDYPDIQELLAAADVVITDYSSAIFDFMLTGRPGFLYAEDYEDYEDLRGLYYPLEETPFPLARICKQLLDCIEGFDEAAYEEKRVRFLQEKGSVEDGRAAERVVALIKKIVDKEVDG
ncbi:MAG: CDP-glycerol--poly(glycerophosphate) glycerophosphotransferase [Lachnospiraceae bacterium]|nr:CDP-glycerol--poly(glycerophosphate) glycerophosphotransferase [Lachnospiraceae bacterium]